MRLMKNKKAVVKASITVFSLLAVSAVILFAAGVFAGTHISTIKITSCTTIGNLGECIIAGGIIDHDFDVEVCNDVGSPDGIREFRIYYEWEDFTDFTDVDCLAKTGWDKAVLTTIWGKACIYSSEAESNNIEPGECTDFGFDADTPEEGSCRTLRFETTDEDTPIGDVNRIDAQVCVDADDPLTTKSFIGPYKIENGVEWIDGVTEIELIAIDPEPHPAGVDKTWYMNVIDLTEDSCWNQEEFCNPITEWPGQYLEGYSPYDEVKCINSGQELCSENYEPNTNDWYDCVEGYAYNKCNIDPLWKLYRGTPISKDEESCHMLQFFSIDKVGKVENYKTNCFFVDKTPPIITKEVGEPNLPCGDGEECDYFISSETDITLTCEDQEPHPSNDVTIYWRYKVDEDGDGFGDESFGQIFSENAGEAVFNFPEPSMHQLEYWCVDAVEKESEHFFEIDKVDNEPPEITKKMIGLDNFGDCPPQDEDDVCYVADNGRNGVSITVHDPEPHPVNEVSCRYELWWNGQNIADVPNTFGGEGKEIIFHEDSTHTLKIWCEDALGNEIYDEEEFLVDSTPPETTKRYVGTQYPNPIIEGQTPYPHWINSTTLVELSATDEKVGVGKTYWRNTVVDNIYCQTEASGCTTATGSGDFKEYIEPFNKPEESCHLIEYYSVDKLGNAETPKKQCVYVDNKAPIASKYIGNPKIECDEGQSCDYYVSQETPISLICQDQQPHPVDHNFVWYRYKVSDDCENLESAEWTEWVDPLVGKEIHFEEDSCHQLEWYCVDALGNKGEVQSEIDIVDSKAPEIEKEIIGPYVMCDGSEDGEDGNGGEPASSVPSPGTNLRQINGTYSQPCSINTGIAFDGTNLIMSCWDHNNLDFLNPVDGSLDHTLDIPGYSGLHANAWDGSRNKLWQCAEHNKVLLVDTSDGSSVLYTHDGIQCTDGLAYDGSDDTLWISPDVSGTIYHYKINGDSTLTQIGSFSLSGKIGNCGNSGIAVGGEKLYLANNGCSEIYEVTKDLSSSTLFASFPERLEDMECDDITFASQGVGAIWSQDAYDRKINAYAIPQGQCGFGGLPPEPQKDCFIIDGVTEIHVDAFDPEPHPVDDVMCEWGYTWNEQFYGWFEEELPFVISGWEESKHDLEIHCWDALGNEIRDIETFFVDKTPPVIEKTYEGPYFSVEGVEWINSDTQILMSAYDPEPHPSGLDSLEYRITLVGDEACRNRELCQETQGIGDWTEYNDESNVNINEESCHLIEITATDNVEKTSTHKQCVFVDNSAPEPNKTVGEIKTTWDGKDSVFYPNETQYCWSNDENEIECWRVTLDTPITLDCQDPEPHPVDHEQTCFMIGLDGEDATEQYCENLEGSMNENGYCCGFEAPYEFNFAEESEHNLKFYCEDALGNAGEIDEEKFKVFGKMWEIPLYKKWNLISVPFDPLNTSVEKVFQEIDENINAVWTYNGEEGKWYVYRPGVDDGDETNNLKNIETGVGYWVMSLEDDSLVVGGSLLSPGPVVPPSNNLADGWNLIGHYGTDSKQVYCSLYSLIDTSIGYPRWSSLYGYDSLGDEFEGLNPWDDTEPGKGYWIEMDVEDLYTPSTLCWGFP